MVDDRIVYAKICTVTYFRSTILMYKETYGRKLYGRNGLQEYNKYAYA
jgi:hypothetical protein